MSQTLTVGKARLCTVIVHNPDGTVNTTAPLTPSVPFGSTAIRMTVNPSDPRQVAVVGVAPNTGIGGDLAVNVGTVKHFGETFIVAAAAVDQSSITGTFGPEIDPPSWA